MDLGSLELQIFVSLTVVLGGAFVALVCDYLKGNNEQLREHNIELRVRKEEQERRLLLDPAGFLGQWMPGQRQAAARTVTAAEPSVVNRAVAPHEVMQSFADPEALAEANDRAAKLHARAGDEPFETADVPPMTQRRTGRNRGNRKSSRQVRKEPENYADWVRPEVIAKVARRAQANAAYSSDIREDLESLPEEALPEPLNAPENWDIRQQLPANDRTRREQPKRSTPRTEEAPAAAQVTTAAVAVIAEPAVPQETVAAAAQIPQEAPLPEKLAPEEAVILQKEIERVAQLERRPVTAAPGTILRPLTVPSLKLEDELHRVAEIAQPAAPAAFTWNSALLDEVIAASGTRAVVAHTAAPLVAAAEPVVVAETVPVPVVVEEAVAAAEAQEEVELVEVSPIVAASEPEPVPTEPVVEELATIDVTLGNNEYWEPAASSSGGGLSSDIGEPDAGLPESPSVDFVITSPSADAGVAPESADSAPEMVEPLAPLAEPVAIVAGVDDEPVSTGSLPVEEPLVIAAVEPEPVLAAPVVEELVTVDVALDQSEYWEPTAVATDQPEVVLPEAPAVEMAVDAVSALAETVAAVASVDEEPVSTGHLLVEEPVVIATVELSSTPAEPVAAELVAVDAALDQHEYWEPAAVSIDQPEVIQPEVPAVELAVATLSVQTDTVAEQSESMPEPVQAFALFSETAVTIASVDEEPVSTGDALAIEPELESIAIAEVTELLAETNPLERTVETPLTPVEALPALAESEQADFVEAFLPAELLQPVPIELDVEPPPFVYLIDSVVEPVELRETEPQLPVVLEVAQDPEATEASAVEPPPFVFEFDSYAIPEPIAEPEPVVAEVAPVSAAEIIDCYSFWPRQSRLAGMGISPMVDYLQSIPGVETPSVRLPLVAEPALSFIEAESGIESIDESSELPDLLPAFADLAWEDAATVVPAEPEVLAAIAEPPPLWIPELQSEPERNQSLVPAAPIDISALRQPEPELIAPAPPTIPDLLLPTGMHDISTWTRLLSLPNPMTGILIVISLQPSENRSALPQPKGAAVPENNAPAIDKFMASFVREGDFGSHISENQWVFIYSNDVAGFNQRRVGTISEKLWDFQLRHLGLANVNFKWGAIDVQSEPLSAALDAARDRMNQTNRARKLPGADRVAPRRVVNG